MTDIKIDFSEFVNIFNSKGKNAARLFAKEKYNRCFEYIQRRIRHESEYYFDRASKKYKNKDSNIIEAEFMSLEDLDNYGTQSIAVKKAEPPSGLCENESYEKLINELIKDRIIELSKYISIDHVTRQLLVKSNVIKNDGFNLVIT